MPSDAELENKEWRAYAKAVRNKDRTPENPFAHAHILLDDGRKIAPTDMMRLVDKNIKLANIDSDDMMRIIILRLRNLTFLAAIAEKNPELLAWFEYEYSKFRSSMEITRAFKGRERWFQNAPGQGDAYLGGYGQNFELEGESAEGAEGGMGFKMPKLAVNREAYGMGPKGSRPFKMQGLGE